MKIHILIPIYNEEKTIEKLIDNLNKTNFPSLIVSDGSTDKTNSLLAQYQKYFITYHKNRGKGYAIKRGAESLFVGDYEWILVIDGDLQNNITDISQFTNALKIHPEAKIIIGNRLHNPIGMPLIRLWTNRFMSWLISLLAGQKIRDSQCGFRLIHRDVFGLKLKSNRFEFESEMLIRAGKAKMKITSVPVRCIYSEKRVSKIKKIPDTLRFFRMIFRIILFHN